MEPDDELIIHGIDIKKMFGDPPLLLGMPVVISATIPDNIIAFGDTTPVKFGVSPLRRTSWMKIAPHPGVDYALFDDTRPSVSEYAARHRNTARRIRQENSRRGQYNRERTD